MSSSEDPTQLLGNALDGDQDAWDALIEQYRSLVWAVVRSAGVYGDDAEDAFQMTFVRLIERGRSIVDASRLGGWLATTARNESRNIQRRQRRIDHVEEWDDRPDPSARALDHGLLSVEDESAVRRAFAELTERCQQLLRLLFTDPPLEYDDIGATLDMPVGSIGPTRARCLERLRRSRHLSGAR